MFIRFSDMNNIWDVHVVIPCSPGLNCDYGIVSWRNHQSKHSLPHACLVANADWGTVFSQNLPEMLIPFSFRSLTEVEQMANKNENTKDTEEEEIVTK